MRRWVFPLMLGVMVFGPVSSGAAESSAPISVELRGEPLRQALARTLEKSKLRYTVEASVPDVSVSVELRGVYSFRALQAIVEQASLQVPRLQMMREGSLYVVGIRAVELGRNLPPWNEDQPASVQRSVSISADRVSLNDAVTLLAASTGLHISVDPVIRSLPVSLEVKDVPCITALRLLVRQVIAAVPNATYWFSGDAMEIGFPAGWEKEEEGTINLDLRGVPLRKAIQLVREGSGGQSQIDPNVPDVPVTLSLRNISREAAFRIIVRQAGKQITGGLTWSRNN